MEVPTVKIANGEGFLVINEEDFDEEIHTLYEEAGVKKEDGPPDYSTLSKDELIIEARKQGKKANNTMSKDEVLAIVTGGK